MPFPLRGWRVSVQLIGLMVLTLCTGCALGEVFASSGVKAVTISVESDTVVALFTTPEVPLVVRVMSAGKELATPRFTVASSDSSVLEPNPARDSLIAHSVGHATITVQLMGSMFTDTVPTLRQDFRVRP